MRETFIRKGTHESSSRAPLRLYRITARWLAILFHISVAHKLFTFLFFGSLFCILVTKLEDLESQICGSLLLFRDAAIGLFLALYGL